MRRTAIHFSHSAGLADVSWTVKLDLKGRGLETIPALPEGARSWLLGPYHALVTCDPGERSSVLDSISRAADVWMTDVTSVYAQFLLAGPRSRDVLAKLTSLNISERALPDWGCGQASLAHVHATILRQDLGALPAFHLLVSREYGESVWEALLQAGSEFQLEPIGLEDLGIKGG